MIARRASRIKLLGGVRLAVGLGLIAAPRLVAQSDDASFALLIRTIGIRDAVLGAGTLASTGDSASTLWGLSGLSSDSLDIVAGAAALPRVGLSGGLVAALVPVPFALAGAWALRGSGS